jgi:hypothetical protein
MLFLKIKIIMNCEFDSNLLNNLNIVVKYQNIKLIREICKFLDLGEDDEKNIITKLVK